MGFYYFGYGSNMDLASMRAKGVEPKLSERCALRGWQLRFNVRHFFRHEGGVANIERTGRASDIVRGVVHLCEDAHLPFLDAAEACGHGYGRVEVVVTTDRGERCATAYVGRPSFLDDTCLPAQRYKNILLNGAKAAGLDGVYIEMLQRQPVLQPMAVPRFVPPSGDYPTFTAETLASYPLLTALAGSVFDMSAARWEHTFLHGLFGGKDMTLFHLKRLDSSDGCETLEHIKHDLLTQEQRRYLNAYLHEYGKEYVYVGQYVYI